jgi:hypothetical protein
MISHINLKTFKDLFITKFHLYIPHSLSKGD